jgi:hypothetical protein
LSQSPDGNGSYTTRFRARYDDADKVILSSALVLAAILGWTVVAWCIQVVRTDSTPLSEVRPTHPKCKLAPPAKPPLTVSPASGPGSALNILIARNGIRQYRQSGALPVKLGVLCPGSILSTTASDFVSATGQHGQLPQRQIESWAQVDQYGTHVRIFVRVAPRVGVVSGSGGYSGVVVLNDPRAAGGVVSVNVSVLYPYIGVVIPFTFLAAFGGFSWAWLIHNLRKSPTDPDAKYHFVRNLILRIAVILVAAVPVVDLQVLTNLNWQGTLTDYVKLATLAGGAAIAATPTLRALILPPEPAGKKAADQAASKMAAGQGLAET